MYLGKKTTEDIDWVTKMLESKLSSQFIEKATTAIGKLTDKADAKTIAKVVLNLFLAGKK